MIKDYKTGIFLSCSSFSAVHRSCFVCYAMPSNTLVQRRIQYIYNRIESKDTMSKFDVIRCFLPWYSLINFDVYDSNIPVCAIRHTLQRTCTW